MMHKQSVNYFKRLIFVSTLTAISLIFGVIASTTPDWFHYKYTEIHIKLSDIYIGLYSEKKCYILYGCEYKSYSNDTYTQTNYTLLAAQILYALYLFISLCYLVRLWAGMIITLFRSKCDGSQKINGWWCSLFNTIFYLTITVILIFVAKMTIHVDLTQGARLEGIGYGFVLYLLSYFLGIVATIVDIYYKIKEKCSRGHDTRSLM